MARSTGQSVRREHHNMVTTDNTPRESLLRHTMASHTKRWSALRYVTRLVVESVVVRRVTAAGLLPISYRFVTEDGATSWQASERRSLANGSWRLASLRIVVKH